MIRQSNVKGVRTACVASQMAFPLAVSKSVGQIKHSRVQFKFDILNSRGHGLRNERVIRS